MLQEYNSDRLQHIKSEGVIILSSMEGVSQVSFNSDSCTPNSLSQNCCSLNNLTKDSSFKKYEKPGYFISHFVERFIDTEVGQIPVVSRKLSFKDRVQTLGARSGITRNNYKVAPGLYAIGMPNENSEV
ncbi:MAG: hypothetical protein HQK69_06185, partial [Desulfamplus sp.]|nr:hypothetical protein [Desulfamplus sp.]